MESRESRFSPLGWAAFLGVSWTWCIGMYLPILMVRDLGLAGYLVFAIPNVVGAAAMGWVLRSPKASQHLTQTHAAACGAFSLVTNIFHVYWISWLGFWAAEQYGMPTWTLPLLIGIAAAVWMMRLLLINDAVARVTALGTLTVSLIAMAAWLLMPGETSPRIAESLAAVPYSADALWMIPVSTLGFALCPYLDLTFNRARQACDTPGRSRVAFGLGFGVCFALMIVFTLIYAGPLVAFVDGNPDTTSTIAPLLGILLGVHVLLQAVFTVEAHHREIARSIQPIRIGVPIGFLIALGLGVAAARLADQRWFDMAPGEIGYRVLLSFYGLVFPAYVWINVIDLRARRMRSATRRSLAVTAAAIALAAPFYFVGFIMRDEPWLAPGFLIVILAKLAAGRADRARPLPSA